MCELGIVLCWVQIAAVVVAFGVLVCTYLLGS